MYLRFVSLFAFLVCSLAVAAPPAAAQETATTNMPVSATVQSACSVSADPLAFGNYDPTAVAPLDANTTLSVLCTVGTSFTVGLNAGIAPGATVTTRQMSNGGERLNYALYQEGSYSTNWGDTPASERPPATTALAAPTSLTVYGRVPALQNVAAGNYADTVTVTVYY